MSPSKARLPFIFFIDLDKTLVGDVSLLVSWLFVHRYASRLVAAGELDAAVPPLDFGSVMASKPVVRPGYADFHQALAKSVQGAEFFVLTCGSADWAAELVPQLERHLRVVFNRPLFARESSCIQYMGGSRWNMQKSVHATLAHAAKALAAKYPALRGKADAELVGLLRDRVLLVDDQTHLSNGRQITCSEYIPMCHFDMLQGWPKSLTQHAGIQDAVRCEYMDYLREWSHRCQLMQSTAADGELIHIVRFSGGTDAEDVRTDDFWPRLKALLVPALKRKASLTDAQVAKLDKDVRAPPKRSAATKAVKVVKV